MRIMAEVVKIESVEHHPNADALDFVRVKNWQCIVVRDEYKVGDLVVYVSIDAWVPHALAPFLSKGREPREYLGVKGNVVRTIKLRGSISQGLILPKPTTLMDAVEGDDLSAFFGIQKYEPPIPASLSGIVKGGWPSATVKTDEERIQNFSDEDWFKIKQSKYEVTEKLDGSSCQIGRINGEFLVLSRNLNLGESDTNSMWQQARRYNIEQKMIDMNIDNVMFQFEIVGPGIQGNKLKLPVIDIYMFAAYNTFSGVFISPKARNEFAAMLGIKHVPVISESFDFGDMKIDDVLEMANAKSLVCSQADREGIVFKAIDGQTHFKAISNTFLLKYGE